jgi:uncharacterized SAM-binding protein YcdF (DUF218 family)
MAFVFVLSCSGLEQSPPAAISPKTTASADFSEAHLFVKRGGQLEARLIKAHQVWNTNRSSQIVVAGGRGPLLRLRAEPSSAVMARYLVQQHNVPAASIIEEPYSLSTIENAAFIYFILLHRQVKHIALVTHAYHMKRSAFIMSIFFPRTLITQCPVDNSPSVTSDELQQRIATEERAMASLYSDLQRYCCFRCKTITEPSMQDIAWRSAHLLVVAKVANPVVDSKDVRYRISCNVLRSLNKVLHIVLSPHAASGAPPVQLLVSQIPLEQTWKIHVHKAGQWMALSSNDNLLVYCTSKSTSFVVMQQP